MPLVLEPSWVGRRVSIRRVVDRSPDGHPVFGDVVGDLLVLDAQAALVEARGGRVEIPIGAVAAARIAVPSTADELALDTVAAHGWQAEETAEIGGWLLRAARGFTSRANSVLPLRQPGRPLDDALSQAREWYAARGLPLRVQLPVHARRLVDAERAGRGWPASQPAQVMAARLDTLLAATPAPAPTAGSRAEVAAEPDDAWFAGYRDGAGQAPAARGVLRRHERAGFAMIRSGGQVMAIGRGTVDGEWLGVTAVEVAAERRRQGLATDIMRALWLWGARAGAMRTYLDVSADNGAALALYQHLGYWQHHSYHYRTEP
jgi:ribosomal protein S18 acetylase RimI-like enzyme